MFLELEDQMIKINFHLDLHYLCKRKIKIIHVVIHKNRL